MVGSPIGFIIPANDLGALGDGILKLYVKDGNPLESVNTPLVHNFAPKCSGTRFFVPKIKLNSKTLRFSRYCIIE